MEGVSQPDKTSKDLWKALWRLIMLQTPKIEQIARMRRFEIVKEISKSPFMEKRITRAEIRKREALDLNIRVSLLPRFSFSIWMGRGV